jgi:2,4-dienoyl-CoA reductase (NADPH2)
VPSIAGIDHPKAISYPDLLTGARQAGEAVAIVGAGGIGFDVATFLTHREDEDYFSEWGIDRSWTARGGVVPARHAPARRRVYLLQRKAERLGQTLGKTTGWIHRTALKARGVVMRGGVSYQRIDDAGLHITTERGPELLAVDHVIICAGQESVTQLATELTAAGRSVHVIGGALLAAELDAERAIREGPRSPPRYERHSASTARPAQRREQRRRRCGPAHPRQPARASPGGTGVSRCARGSGGASAGPPA